MYYGELKKYDIATCLPSVNTCWLFSTPAA